MDEMAKNYFRTETIETVLGEVTAYGIPSDVNGNPRWVIHYRDLYEDYRNNDRLEHGFKLYTAKWFGGGYVIQSYDIQGDIKNIAEKIKAKKEA